MTKIPREFLAAAQVQVVPPGMVEMEATAEHDPSLTGENEGFLEMFFNHRMMRMMMMMMIIFIIIIIIVHPFIK